MEKLKINEETAKRIYADSKTPDSLKEILVETFGKECFKKRTFNNIKTFEDACEELNIDPHDVFNSKDLPDEIAYRKLKVIIKAVNQGWTPNWNNTDQYKWSPWFKFFSSGFGFSYSDCTYDNSATDVGSRLCTDSSDKALYIAKQFKAEYQEYFLYSE